jgi:hypothetical protein
VGREEGKRKVVCVGRKDGESIKAAWLLLKPPLLKPLFFSTKNNREVIKK